MNIFNSKLIGFLLLEILLIPVLFKLLIINFFFINHEESLFYRIFQTLAHDSIIYFLIILFIYISYLKFIKYYMAIVLRLFALVIFLLYIIDLFVLNSFATHLILGDIIKYITYAPKYIQQLYSLNILIILASLIAIVLILIFIFKNYQIQNKRSHYTYLTSIVLCFTLFLFADNGRYIHSWLYKNFIEYNYDIIEQSNKYSNDFKKNLSVNHNQQCIKSEKNNKNIIVLMVESLASYQSEYFSNIKNWTPQLDKIAKENISFKNFYANGFVTEDAEISILTGKFPIYASSSFSNGGGVSFSGFYNIKDSLADILNKEDYQTEFITSSDLEFSNTGLWAKSIGFKHIEGSEQKLYSDKKRFHFNAAGDEFLYQRVLKRVSKQEGKYFLFIKTVSSHAPFINPENENRSEEETIRYVDKQIGNFYNKLNEMNFFKDGLLIIVGDHHPVIPIRKEQVIKHGIYKAPAFVPMILVDNKKQKEVNLQAFQQVDIYNSIKNYVLEQSCTSIWNGDFISSKTNPKYIIHRRGDQRGIISVFNENKIFNIKLNGDNTKIIEDEQNEEVLNKINYMRIQREKKEFNEISITQL